MIERISELPWASFERQLQQKCYELGDYSTRVGKAVSYPSNLYLVPINEADSEDAGEQQSSVSKVCWTVAGSDTEADITYCIQHQIIYNISALLGEKRAEPKEFSGRDPNSWASATETFFWEDLVRYTADDVPEGGDTSIIGTAKRGPFSDTSEGRQELTRAGFFENNTSFSDDNTDDTGSEKSEKEIREDQILGIDQISNLPKTHAAQSLIEISEYIGGSKSAVHSNYVSRKISLAWLFNVIKAIVDVKRWFPWLIISGDTTEEDCKHTEAENDPDDDRSPTGSHRYKRCKDPKKFGKLMVYGNAELNGKVTTFHSQTRFHAGVRMWDSLHVYGQSYFAKDINGTAMRVRWGDLAEYYKSDSSYPPGTLVKFGGDQEITVADDTANAIVTTNPGLVLNEDCSKGNTYPLAIALVGRVPVKVWGECKKFDLLVPDPHHPGWAKVKDNNSQKEIARVLESGPTGPESTVMCATNFRI